MNRRTVCHRMVCVLLALTAGCSPRGVLRKATPPAADSVGRAAIGHAADGTLASLDAMLDPAMQTPRIRKTVTQVQTILRSYSVDPPELIGYSWSRKLGEELRTLTYQAHLRPTVNKLLQDQGRSFHWIVARVVLRGGDDAYRVYGFHVNFNELSLAETNGFGRNLGLPQLLWLLLTVFAFGTVVYAIIQVMRAPLPRRWPWVLVSLLGAGAATMNWTTGAFSIQPLFVEIFAAGFGRLGLYGPIMLTWGFPAGAFWALEVVRRARRRAAFIAMLERGPRDPVSQASRDDTPT